NENRDSSSQRASSASLGALSGQYHPHRDQSPPEWIQHQAKALEGRHTKQRLVALLTEDHWRRSAVAIDLKVGIADLPSDGCAVGQRERDLPVRAQTKLPQSRPGDEAIDGA